MGYQQGSTAAQHQILAAFPVKSVRLWLYSNSVREKLIYIYRYIYTYKQLDTKYGRLLMYMHLRVQIGKITFRCISCKFCDT